MVARRATGGGYPRDGCAGAYRAAISDPRKWRRLAGPTRSRPDRERLATLAARALGSYVQREGAAGVWPFYMVERSLPVVAVTGWRIHPRLKTNMIGRPAARTSCAAACNGPPAYLKDLAEANPNTCMPRPISGLSQSRNTTRLRRWAQ